MNEQLEQLKINADNISSVLSRKKSSLRGIKVERKRLLLKQADDKKKRKAEKKLEAKKSPFGNSLKKIKKTTSTNNLFKGLGGNLMKFISLLLLGIALNNLDEIKEAVTKAFKNVKEGLTTVSNVIKTIYEKTEDFVNMFNNDEQNEDNFEKLNDEMEEVSKMSDKLSPLMKTINNALNKAGGTEFGSTTASGTLPTGETFDVINVFDKDKGDTSIIRLKENDGSFSIISKEELETRMSKIINPNNSMRMVEIEDNQWWDIADRFPDNVKYIDVYNAKEDFNAKEELKRLQKTNPKRYSDTIIRIQPVIIDPE
mgnify:FL=1